MKDALQKVPVAALWLGAICLLVTIVLLAWWLVPKVRQSPIGPCQVVKEDTVDFQAGTLSFPCPKDPNATCKLTVGFDKKTCFAGPDGVCPAADDDTGGKKDGAGGVTLVGAPPPVKDSCSLLYATVLTPVCKESPCRDKDIATQITINSQKNLAFPLKDVLTKLIEAMETKQDPPGDPFEKIKGDWKFGSGGMKWAGPKSTYGTCQVFPGDSALPYLECDYKTPSDCLLNALFQMVASTMKGFPEIPFDQRRSNKFVRTYSDTAHGIRVSMSTSAALKVEVVPAESTTNPAGARRKSSARN